VSGYREGTPDPGLCSLRHCDETAGHDGPHKKVLYDGFGFGIATGRPKAVQLWLSGESARVRGIVLVVADHETGLTWPMVRELSQVLESATMKWWPTS
jgi:hypothetical protein